MIVVTLYYKFVDGAYIVSSGPDRESIAFGAMALHKNLDEAVADIRNEQIPMLAKHNHNLDTLPEFEIKLVERGPDHSYDQSASA